MRGRQGGVRLSAEVLAHPVTQPYWESGPNTNQRLGAIEPWHSGRRPAQQLAPRAKASC